MISRKEFLKIVNLYVAIIYPFRKGEKNWTKQTWVHFTPGFSVRRFVEFLQKHLNAFSLFNYNSQLKKGVVLCLSKLIKAPSTENALIVPCIDKLDNRSGDEHIFTFFRCYHRHWRCAQTFQSNKPEFSFC